MKHRGTARAERKRKIILEVKQIANEGIKPKCCGRDGGGARMLGGEGIGKCGWRGGDGEKGREVM